MTFSIPSTDAQILIVDDEAYNVRLIHSVLKSKGYRVAALTQAELFFEVVKEVQPDLILLDVMMPPFSGFDLCRQLKEQQEYASVPVIFLTGMADESSVIEGFEVGGVDYITKPFSAAELLARVKNHVVLRLQHKRLVVLNQEKNSILMVASHDLRNPFATIQMAAQLLASTGFSEADRTVMLETIQHASERGLDLIENLLDVHRIEAGFSEPDWQNVALHELLSQVQLLYKQSSRRKDITLRFQGLGHPVDVRSDPKLLLQIVDNLLSNAIKYTDPGCQVFVSLSTTASPGGAVIRICDEGPGFTEEDQKHLYQKFAQLSARPTANESSNGLGLAIVKELCDKLDIQIHLDTSPRGSCFTLHL